MEHLVRDPAGAWHDIADRLGRPDLGTLGDTPVPRSNVQQVRRPGLEARLNRALLPAVWEESSGLRRSTSRRVWRYLEPRLPLREERWPPADASAAERAVVAEARSELERVHKTWGCGALPW
jgi:hypothetical protein